MQHFPGITFELVMKYQCQMTTIFSHKDLTTGKSSTLLHIKSVKVAKSMRMAEKFFGITLRLGYQARNYTLKLD